MSHCIFSYLIAEHSHGQEYAFPELPVQREFGCYQLHTDASTPFLWAAHGSVQCGVFGLAVNVHTGDSQGIAQEIAGSCTCIQDVVEYEKQLGGKYLILFSSQDQYALLGDATCSIPIFYNTEGSFLCSSNEHIIAKLKQYPLDEAFSAIRRSGDISQAMPYDITPYRQIKQLIPNHYLDLNQQRSVRFVNASRKQTPVPVEEATKQVLPMVQTLLNFYLTQEKLYCPLTAGRDSRVVLSFLLNSGADFSCYTIRHPEHQDHTQDITVPVELCNHVGIPHKLVEDVTLSEDLIRSTDQILGQGCYSMRTLRIAQTIREYFGDGAILNGDIIGQVGKCSLHRDIPAIFATPSYFRCKMHNFSKGAKKQLKLWLSEIKDSGEQVNTFDLFSIENRMGRWAAQTSLVYNTLGQNSLNIFNSRSILYIWTGVDRKKRKTAALHADLIRNTWGALAELPFEKDESLAVRLSKSTGMIYLLSSYMKFYLEKLTKRVIK